MSTFDDDALGELISNFRMIEAKRKSLMLSLYPLDVSNPNAQKFLHQGVLRRISILAKSIKTVFETIPPDVEGIPNEEDRILATICLHAFIINVFGTLDCLLHVWVNEFGLKDKRGNTFPNTAVGFGTHYKDLFSKLPESLQKKIVEHEKWLKGLGSFRHALAHRVPPYIPPHMVDPSNEAEYNRLNAMWYNSLDMKERAGIQREMEDISHFKAFLAHDIEESPPIAFHSQIVIDFLTIEDICAVFVAEFYQQKKFNERNQS